jgi:hypothetical protein
MSCWGSGLRNFILAAFMRVEWMHQIFNFPDLTPIGPIAPIGAEKRVSRQKPVGFPVIRVGIGAEIRASISTPIPIKINVGAIKCASWQLRKSSHRGSTTCNSGDIEPALFERGYRGRRRGLLRKHRIRQVEMAVPSGLRGET